MKKSARFDDGRSCTADKWPATQRSLVTVAALIQLNTCTDSSKGSHSMGYALLCFRPTNAANLHSHTCLRRTLFTSVLWQRGRERNPPQDEETQRRREREVKREKDQKQMAGVDKRERPSYQRARQHKSPLHTHSRWGFMISTGRKQSQMIRCSLLEGGSTCHCLHLYVNWLHITACIMRYNCINCCL